MKTSCISAVMGTLLSIFTGVIPAQSINTAFDRHPEKQTISKGSPSESSPAGAQKIDSTITESWDTTANQWIVTAKREYTYDSRGYNIRLVGYFRDETTGKLTSYYKEE